ncbi:MAG: flgC, partial [Micavibrio sp.]|nr:flgC [Micavibrio sp.]
MADLYSALKISAYGMKAESQRVRVIAENMANANTGPTKLGEDPYTRKTITFKNEMNRAEGMDLVNVDKIAKDTKAP